MRLIDADALYRAGLDEYISEYGGDEYEFDETRFSRLIQSEPTATVERDIPKAPTDQQLEEDAYGAWGSLYGNCPNCKGTVYDEQNYCEKCGQRLDWGNGDPNGFNDETVQALKDTTERKNLSKVYENLDDMYADMVVEELHDLIRAIGTITYGKERWFDNNDGTWYDRNECDNVPLGTVVDRLIREVSWLEEQYENAVD